MKFLSCFLLALSSLYAQPEAGGAVIDFGGGTVYNPETPPTVYVTSYVYLVSYIKYNWTIVTSANGGGKYFIYAASQCSYDVIYGSSALSYLAYTTTGTKCVSLDASAAENVGPIKAGLAEFNSLASVFHHPPIDEAVARTGSHPHLTTVQPTVPEDPQMILFDGIGWAMDKIDLNTFAISQVPLDFNLIPFVNTFGLRPVNTGDAHEVWIAGPSPGPTGISIADFSTVQVATGIPGLALASNDNPVSVVFTNDGATALVAVSQTPDAAGNNGAILAFDAVGRTLTSRLPIKNAPQQLLMAPDGLTAYSLGTNGTITYYDVLSGTADLTAPFALASPGGVFIHPDGKRLFCVLCGDNSLDVFDLTTRQFTSTFPVNYAVHAVPQSANMSQDGSIISATDNQYNVYMIDTRYGNLLTTYPNATASMVFPGAPVN